MYPHFSRFSWSSGNPEVLHVNTPLGPIYTKRQCQHCDNSVMTLEILFSLKSMELFQNGVATYFQATPLISMRTESQSHCSVDADVWCKRALNRGILGLSGPCREFALLCKILSSRRNGCHCG